MLLHKQENRGTQAGYRTERKSHLAAPNKSPKLDASYTYLEGYDRACRVMELTKKYTLNWTLLSRMIHHD